MTARADTVSFFACGRPKRAKCSSHDCSRYSEAKCQYPIREKRIGGTTTDCLREVCRGCVVVIDSKTYCAAHGRALKLRPAVTRTDSEQ
jgi:hypothetical protein